MVAKAAQRQRLIVTEASETGSRPAALYLTRM